MNSEKTRYHINHIHYSSPIDYGSFALVQVGRRYCESGAIIAEHWQNEYYEMTVVTAGSGYISTNGVDTHVKEGDIYLSFPSELHEIRASAADKFEYDFFSFIPTGLFSEELKKLSEDYFDPTNRVFRDGTVSDLVASVVAEVSDEKPYGKELINAVFGQIVVHTLRRFARIERSTANVSDAEIFCQRLMSFIDTNIYSLKNLSELSDEFGYNYSYISSLFKRTTGNTLLDYFRKRKLAIAKALLSEEKSTVGKVAERLGYSSPFSFSTAFKGEFGVSPKEFKESTT